jgi:uncharacterized protein (UPF0276 family)
MQSSSVVDLPRSRSALLDGLPAKAGIGLKPQHFQEVLATRPGVGFFEVHAENYMVDGGPMHHWLGRIREHYPLSLHGVGLSLGAEVPPDEAHLDRLARLIDRYQPTSFSEHLAWSTHREVFLNDLLPVAYNGETLARVCRHIDRVQERLHLRMLLENPSTYVEFERSTMDEATFLAEVLRRTGCGLLLDVTNAHVSCTNHGRDVGDYLEALPLGAVGEIHLAGFAEDTDAAGDPLLIDHHGSAVAEIVWGLYAGVINRIGARPTLLERDNDVPSFGTLHAEALQAQALLAAAREPRHSDCRRGLA